MKKSLMVFLCFCLIAAMIPTTSAWTDTLIIPAWGNMYPNASQGNYFHFGDNQYASDNTSSTSWSSGGYSGFFKLLCSNQSSKIRIRSTENVSWKLNNDNTFFNYTNYFSATNFELNWQEHEIIGEMNISCAENQCWRLDKNGGQQGDVTWFGFSDYQCNDIVPAPVADFNATPLNGTAPLYVSFQDTSTGSPTSHNWTITPANGLIGNTSTSAYPTIVFTLPGNYTVNHCVANAYGSDCEEKTNYIWVQNATADFVTTTFWAVDPLGHRVWDSAISLQDVGNSSWTNTSSPSGGVATITSLIGHVINGYATAAGYNDGETLGITADGVSGGIILMTPTNITNVSAGYVSLYVYVKESVGNAPISGAYVNLAYAEGATTRNDGSTTNTEGVASFVVPNNTLIYIYGEKAGYTQVSTTKDSGTGSGGDAAVSVILYMTGQTVTPTVTATTGPGGTVPVTVDPRTPQEKESDIALILIDYGDMLVMFFIALTVIGGVKMIMK